jgi:hypothetical protein
MLNPDFVVQYDSSLQWNRSEGTGDPLFADDTQRRWFLDRYAPVATFRTGQEIPWMDAKEKAFIVLQRRSP